MPELSLKIKSFDIHVDGHCLFVRRFCHENAQKAAGSAHRPVVVMLHEALGCVSMLRDVPEKIAGLTGCDVMAFDRLGHGRSDPLPASHIHTDYLFDESWNALAGVLDACDIKKPLLWGHSDGGTMALLFASRFPDRVAGLITEAAHVYVDDLTIEGIKAAVRLWHTDNLREKLAKYHGSNVDDIFRRWSTIWLSEDFLKWNIEGYLGDIKAPLLAFQGADDHYGEVAQLASIAEKAGGPSKKVVVPGCGHIPHLQAFEAVIAAAAPFVREVFAVKSMVPDKNISLQ